MSRQNSQKSGMRSEAQKRAGTRDGYSPVPPSNEVGGASGDPGPNSETDQEVSLKQNVNAMRKKNTEDQSH